jgi:3-methylcrotonyl-CoA carboxylase alpha subunit
LARAHDVPVVPGYDGDDQADDRLRTEAAIIGTPLLIKASAGGGGRGMRVVEDLGEFDEALEAARREAQAAFGDRKMLLERYVARPRHIEFQILADGFGHTIHLGERECSIQRRHQKLLEEAPSVALDAALRERMGAAAVRIARAAAYTGAGTVEFLLDESGAFYFLEMNARLQVEHPVTEVVTGLDLVRLQFAIAAGERLTLAQKDVRARGWAIEARINAEDPANDFLPDSGTITRFEAPSGSGIRVDSGVRSGSNVSIYYDSLLAKVIAAGSDRRSAIARLQTALGALRVEGVRTNTALLLAIAGDEAFAAGATTTAYLNERASALGAAAAEPDEVFLIAAGALLASVRSWRLSGVGIPLRLQGAERSLALTASRSPDGERYTLSGDIALEAAFEVTGGRVVVRSPGSRIAGTAKIFGDEIEVVLLGRQHRLTLAAPPRLGAKHGAAAHGMRDAITSPMPGKIVKVEVAAGDEVAERDLLIVLEAMKMEHRIHATRAGIVKRVAVVPGNLVTGGATLVELEA